jgi:hypothetical protein
MKLCRLPQLQEKKNRFCKCENLKETKSRILNGTKVDSNNFRFAASLVLKETRGKFMK